MYRIKIFVSYVIPSVLAFALMGVYTIVDGFFIGNSVGDIGLSTINIVFPVASLLQALGTGIGMGGAILYAIAMASGQTEKAKDILRSTILLLLLVSIAVMAGLSAFLQQILRLLGAADAMLTMGTDYLRVIILGAAFQILGTGVVPLIRNNNGSAYAMVSMIAGFITNIVLDYLFIWVFGQGMMGAALATITGQAITAILGIIFLVTKKLPFIGLPKMNFGEIALKITKIGIAPFGLTISPIISVVFLNRASIANGGASAVACYACISYATSIVYMLLQGVGDGTQPLMSQEYGKNRIGELHKYRFYAYVTAFAVGAACMAILFVLRYQTGNIFGASATVTADVAKTIPVFLCGIPFLAVARVTSSSLYATEKSILSYILVYAEPILMIGLLFVLPAFYGQDGVWWSMPLAQVMTAGIAVFLKIKADGACAVQVNLVE